MLVYYVKLLLVQVASNFSDLINLPSGCCVHLKPIPDHVPKYRSGFSRNSNFQFCEATSFGYVVCNHISDQMSDILNGHVRALKSSLAVERDAHVHCTRHPTKLNLRRASKFFTLATVCSNPVLNPAPFTANASGRKVGSHEARRSFFCFLR